MIDLLLGGLVWDLVIVLALDAVLWAWVCTMPTLVVRANRLVGPALGMALPGVVLLRRDWFREDVLRHELKHQEQMRRWSPLGASLVLGWGYARQVVEARRERRAISLREFWENNPLEREANDAMHSREPIRRVVGQVPPVMDRDPADR